MPYAKFDNRYGEQRKIRRAWRAFPANPIGLHILAIAYCHRHNCDGCIPTDWIEEMMPKSREREAIIGAMVDLELIDVSPHNDGDYRLHDYLDWNDSAEERDAKRIAAGKAAGIRWGTANGNAKRIANR